MRDGGFLERQAPVPTVAEVLDSKRREEPELPDLVAIESHQKVGQAIELMQRYSISQLPGRPAASRSTRSRTSSARSRSEASSTGLLEKPDALNEDVATAMQPPLRVVDVGDTVDEVFADLSGGSPAVVVADDGEPAGMLTRADLLEYLAHHRDGR